MQTTQDSTSLQTRAPVALFALAAGVLITNQFAPQTLVGLIGETYNLPSSYGGLVAMITLLGYAAGLLFLVPLADLVENRRLVLQMLVAAALSAVGVVFAPNAPALFFLMFVLGAGSSAIQVLVPTAAAMTEPAHRGRVIGDIMSGLLVGILLSRPIASFLAGTWGWKSFYVFSAVSTTLLGLLLALKLPKRLPAAPIAYPALIASMWHLFTRQPVLRDRAISAAIVMAGFNFFWTTIAYVLQAEPFSLSQKGIALFALFGAGGALITPLVGRLADKGHGLRVTHIAHATLIVGFVVAAISGLSTSLPASLLIVGLGISALLLDMGVLGNHTVGRYMINLLNPEARGRINGIFVGVFFIGGAIGSALSGVLWSLGGWGAVCAGGVVLGLLACVARK
ncbi:MFS transporter [Pseudomonas sp. RC10]|uniref:MFS transporter n=1 Tax=Pseudomonas bambusae TaxID=3139142 RepID=UPI0031392601